MPTTQPQLGYGKQSEVSINAVNQWMRSQPWWQQIKGNSNDISDSQKQQILRAAQQQGVVIDEGDLEVDKAGNLNPRGHKIRNTLIVAGIAGATIATMGAAGAFSAAAAPAAAASTAGTTAAAGGIGAAGVGGLTATSLGLPVTAGLGTAGAVGAGAGTAGTLGTAAKIGSVLSGGKGVSGYLDTAGRIANIAGGISAGRQQGRADETNATQAQDRNAVSLYNAQQQATNAKNAYGMDQYSAGQTAANAKNSYGLSSVNAGLGIGALDLNQKQFALSAPGQRASNSVRGDIMANAQDASISAPSTIPVPTISGGMRPSMFSANTRALGTDMSAQALAGQRAGDNFAALPTVPSYTENSMALPTYQEGPAAPTLTGLPQAGAADSWLNTAAQIGSLMGAIPYKRVPKPGDSDYVQPTGGR